jgi:hypothetical protein
LKEQLKAHQRQRAIDQSKNIRLTTFPISSAVRQLANSVSLSWKAKQIN